MKLSTVLATLAATWSLLALAANYDYSDEEGTLHSLPKVTIEQALDLARLGQQARDEGKVIMIEMSATYCGYCKTLEEEIIKPMLRNRDYDARVFIRKLEIDRHDTVIDFDGSKTTPSKFASRHKVWVTPTILFLDGHGRSASESIVGVNTLEFYGGYVDDAINSAFKTINDTNHDNTTH